MKLHAAVAPVAVPSRKLPVADVASPVAIAGRPAGQSAPPAAGIAELPVAGAVQIAASPVVPAA